MALSSLVKDELDAIKTEMDDIKTDLDNHKDKFGSHKHKYTAPLPAYADGPTDSDATTDTFTVTLEPHSPESVAADLVKAT